MLKTLLNNSIFSISIMTVFFHQLGAELKTDVLIDFEEPQIIPQTAYRPSLTTRNFVVTTKVISDFTSVFISSSDRFNLPSNDGNYLRCITANEGITISHESGNLFQVLSFDLSEYSQTYPDTPITVECIGIREDGVEVRHNITTDGINDGYNGENQDFQKFQLPSEFDRLKKFEIMNPPFNVDNLTLSYYGEASPKEVNPIKPVYYDLDWNFSEFDNLAETGIGNQITSINFGNATVRESYGLMNEQPVELSRLDDPNSRYGQIEFALQKEQKFYSVEFELYRTDTEEFSVFFDTNNGFFKVILTDTLSLYLTHPQEGNLKDVHINGFQIGSDQIYRIRIEYDINNSWYRFYVDKTLVSEGPGLMGVTDVKDIRFSYHDIEGNGGAAIDNVRITGKPGSTEPAFVGGAMFNPENNHSYYLLEQSDWLSARNVALKFGADLAVIETESEKEWINSVIGTYIQNTDAVWVGLVKTVDDWKWINNGSPIDFSFTEIPLRESSSNDSIFHSAVVGEFNAESSQLNFSEKGIEETHYALIESPVSLPHPFPSLIQIKHKTAFAIESEVGEFIGNGRSHFHTSKNSAFLINLNSDNSISLSITSEKIQWLLQFGGKNQELLQKGIYLDALQNPEDIQKNPKLIVINNLRSSQTVIGSFEIKEITYDHDIITSFWVVFRLKADQSLNELAGELKYNAL